MSKSISNFKCIRYRRWNNCAIVQLCILWLKEMIYWQILSSLVWIWEPPSPFRSNFSLPLPAPYSSFESHHSRFSFYVEGKVPHPHLSTFFPNICYFVMEGPNERIHYIYTFFNYTTGRSFLWNFWNIYFFLSLSWIHIGHCFSL